jgi:hypothetical protein
MIKRILGWLLFYANTSPPHKARQAFYALKTKLLHRFGTPLLESDLPNYP